MRYIFYHLYYHILYTIIVYYDTFFGSVPMVIHGKGSSGIIKRE